MGKSKHGDFEFTMRLSPQNSVRKGQYTKGFLEWEIANLEGVQAEITAQAFAGKVRAEANLLAARLESLASKGADSWDSAFQPNFGQSYIEVERGDTDAFVALVDERSDNAAAVIEYGHAGYTLYREHTDEDGKTVRTKHKVKPQRGKFILHEAFRLRPTRKNKKPAAAIVRIATKKGRKGVKIK